MGGLAYCTFRAQFLSIAVTAGLLTAVAVCVEQPSAPAKPRVILIGVNGGEWDLIRPLMMNGGMPNLARLVRKGVSGRLRTSLSPVCPQTYASILTSTATAEHGISGFLVNGITAASDMLKTEPIWSILSKQGITVGMANVPATFPAQRVNGYMISGMLTRGKTCPDGILCDPRLSEVQGGDAVYPKNLAAELETKVGDFWIDCSSMPSAQQLQQDAFVHDWLDHVAEIRKQQTRLFEYLLAQHPTDFTMFAQSCEDRLAHWLYPIQSYNVGYSEKLHGKWPEALADQYRAFDEVLGKVLEHADERTYVFVFSDHGIKPVMIPERKEGYVVFRNFTTPIVAKHDFEDGDEIPGFFVVAGPGITKNVRIPGLQVGLLDIAPTILHIYGIPLPKQMKGRVLTELFEAESTAN